MRVTHIRRIDRRETRNFQFKSVTHQQQERLPCADNSPDADAEGDDYAHGGAVDGQDLLAASLERSRSERAWMLEGAEIRAPPRSEPEAVRRLKRRMGQLSG
jgi:hypothetical protein